MPVPSLEAVSDAVCRSDKVVILEAFVLAGGSDCSGGNSASSPPQSARELPQLHVPEDGEGSDVG